MTGTDGVGVWPNVSSLMLDESRSRSRSPLYAFYSLVCLSVCPVPSLASWHGAGREQESIYPMLSLKIFLSEILLVVGKFSSKSAKVKAKMPHSGKKLRTKIKILSICNLFRRKFAAGQFTSIRRRCDLTQLSS